MSVCKIVICKKEKPNLSIRRRRLLFSAGRSRQSETIMAKGERYPIMKTSLFYSIAIILFLIQNTQSFGQNPEKPQLAKLHTIWTNKLSHQNWTDTEVSLIKLPNNEFFAVGSSSFRDKKKNFYNTTWLWKLDEEGNRLWEKEIEIPGIEEIQKIIIGTLLSLKTEPIIILRESPSKTGTWMIKFNGNGEITYCKKLSLGHTSYVLRSFERTKGGFLISGAKLSDDDDAWVLKIDELGHEIWEKTYNNGKSEDAMSMAVADNGSFILGCDSGKYNKFGSGPSSVWIIKCDANGKVLDEINFQGRHPVVAMNKDGTFIVNYNTADFPELTSQIIGLDANLKKRWEPKTLYTGDGIGMYNITTDRNKDIIVIGMKFGPMGVWKISNLGKDIFSGEIDYQTSMAEVKSLSISNDEYIIAGTGTDLSQSAMEKRRNRKKDEPRDNSDIFIAKISLQTKK